MAAPNARWWPSSSCRRFDWRCNRETLRPRRLTVCLTRNLDKLQPLVDEIRAAAAHGFASDARKEEEVEALFDDIEERIGPVEVFVFNIGANVPSGVLEETARKYFKVWEMACFAGFLTAQGGALHGAAAAAPCCSPAPLLRGSANFAAFAAAVPLRALAQSLAQAGAARHPRGARGDRRAIDTAFIREVSWSAMR
jgi:hypothetical protein